MDMNKSFVKKINKSQKWQLIDADGKYLGRLATEIADILRGKDKPDFTPHIDSGEYVVVINCDKIKLTGDKWNKKVYEYFTGWRSGLKKKTAAEAFEKDPTFLIMHAVKGMLPKNRLSRQIIKKLKIYAGSEHPHEAQFNA